MTDYQSGDRVRLKCPCHKGQEAVVVQECRGFPGEERVTVTVDCGRERLGVWLTELEKIA